MAGGMAGAQSSAPQLDTPVGYHLESIALDDGTVVRLLRSDEAGSSSTIKHNLEQAFQPLNNLNSSKGLNDLKDLNISKGL